MATNGTNGVNGHGVNGHATNGSTQPATDKNIHDVLRVDRSAEAFCSSAVSLVDLPAGAVFAKITLATPATKAYTSVQTGPDTHIELNSDLVFCNHSCDPSLEFDMGKMEVRVHPHRDLKKGDALTFFYPSSEWDMAQPFNCTCGAGEGVCCGTIDGASHMDPKVLQKYWLNGHIEALLEKNGSSKNANGNAFKAAVNQTVDAIKA